MLKLEGVTIEKYYDAYCDEIVKELNKISGHSKGNCYVLQFGRGGLHVYLWHAVDNIVTKFLYKDQ